MGKITTGILLLLLVTFPGLAQETSRFGIALYANDAAAPMLGVSYRIAPAISARLSLGYYQAKQSIAPRAHESGKFEERSIRWYGGEAAMLHGFPEFWRLSPYAGVGLQYFLAQANKPGLQNRMDNDRFDANVIGGIRFRIIRHVSIFGEGGVGYATGYLTNSPSGFDEVMSRWGRTHMGLGLRAHFN